MSFRPMVHIFNVLMLSAFAAACQEAEFKSRGKSSKNNSLPPGGAEALSLAVPCLENQPTQPLTIPQAGKYQLQGELCPKGLGDLAVVFIVDFSQSMEFPQSLRAQYGDGNDPRAADGSCGRLRAAQAIVKMLREKSRPEDRILLSSTPFSDEHVSDKSFEAVGLADIDKNLTGDYFCGTIGLTNYAAGLDAALTALQKTQAENKVVYFITDGKPLIKKLDAAGQPVIVNGRTEVDAPTAAKNGLEAADRLRAGMPNAKFYSVFLGNKVEDPQEALKYLQTLSRGEENVRSVDDAQKLAEAILEFAIPGLAIDPNSATAKLNGKKIKIVEAKQNDKNANIWVFKTEGIDFKAGSTHTFELDAQSLRGSTETTRADINVGP